MYSKSRKCHCWECKQKFSSTVLHMNNEISSNCVTKCFQIKEQIIFVVLSMYSNLHGSVYKHEQNLSRKRSHTMHNRLRIPAPMHWTLWTQQQKQQCQLLTSSTFAQETFSAVSQPLTLQPWGRNSRFLSLCHWPTGLMSCRRPFLGFVWEPKVFTSNRQVSSLTKTTCWKNWLKGQVFSKTEGHGKE